jgi:hypothetical protein
MQLIPDSDHPHRVKAVRTPEERARHAAIRAEFADRPDPEKLIAEGKFVRVEPSGPDDPRAIARS